MRPNARDPIAAWGSSADSAAELAVYAAYACFRLYNHHVAVLLTGFEPFGGHADNPSQLLVRELGERDDRVVVEYLPVSYARAADQVIVALRRLNPRALILFGLAAGSSHLLLERVARNRDVSPAPDNDGELRSGPIVADAPDTYHGSLPFAQMAALAGRVNEPARLSQDAGGYVCNHTYFRVAHHLAGREPGTPCGFVHLPMMEPGSRRLKELASLVRAWIDIL